MISAIIITRNEAKMLPGCLATLGWVDELLVVDSASRDETVSIAKKYGAEIISVESDTDYASARNVGLKAAQGNWLFYIDADERVTTELRQEIQQVLKGDSLRQQGVSLSKYYSYKIPRQNIMLGQWIKHGGFWPDYVHRLFHRSALIKWTGKLHESPTVKSEVGLLKQPVKHYTARTITGALAKSAKWAEIEARLLHQSSASQVTWWRIIKVFIFKFWQLLIMKSGFLDGSRGIILAYIQAHHQASVLVNLWQLQQPTPKHSSQ